MFSFIAITCLLGAVAAAPSQLLGPVAVGIDSVSVPQYKFNYAVSDPHTGDNKAQSEVREGGVVKGSYSLTEPDGTLRVVDYAADPVSGFNAVVKRLGPAVHPQQIVAPVVKQIVPAPIITKQIISPIATSIVSPVGLGIGGLGLGYNNIGLGYNNIGLGYNNIGLGINNLGLGYNLGLGLNGLGWKH